MSQEYGAAARTLVDSNSRAALTTISDQMFPYASMVDYAPMRDGDILLLLSGLAEHTRYLQTNPKAGLLVAPHLNDVDAFAKPRVTLLGEVEAVDRTQSLIERFLKFHPKASGYMMMNDFRFFHLYVESARFIGGFGRMAWIAADEYKKPAGATSTP
jgi:heme iron utilization protein